MEIVKRIEGPENENNTEDLNFDFKEHYLQEDKEKNIPIKGIFLLIGGVTLISILGYIGYTNYKTNKISQTKITPPSIMLEKITPKTLKSETKDSSLTQKNEIIIKKVPTIPIKKEIVLYTEELALKHLAPVKSSLKTPSVIKKKTVVEKKIIKQKVKKITHKKNKTIAKSRTITITIKKGDTLALLAKKFYGDRQKFQRIIHANKNIKNHKTNLKIGQRIIIPYIKIHQKRRFVTVKKGYSLAYISKKFYGNINGVDKIVRANSNIKNKKSTLRIGQKVYVPR